MNILHELYNFDLTIKKNISKNDDKGNNIVDNEKNIFEVNDLINKWWFIS